MSHRVLDYSLGVVALVVCAAVLSGRAQAGYRAPLRPPLIALHDDGSGSFSGSIGGVRATSDGEGYIECYTQTGAPGGCSARGQPTSGGSGMVNVACTTRDANQLKVIRSISSYSRITVFFEGTLCTRILVSNGSPEFPHHLEGEHIVPTPPDPPPSPRELALEAFDRDVYAILNTHCYGCHSSWGDRAGMFDFLYGEPVENRSPTCDGQRLVVHGDPDGSVLVSRLEGTACGSRMPTGGRLSSSDIGAIRHWILCLDPTAEDCP